MTSPTRANKGVFTLSFVASYPTCNGSISFCSTRPVNNRSITEGFKLLHFSSNHVLYLWADKNFWVAKSVLWPLFWSNSDSSSPILMTSSIFSASGRPITSKLAFMAPWYWHFARESFLKHLLCTTATHLARCCVNVRVCTIPGWHWVGVNRRIERRVELHRYVSLFRNPNF